MLWSSKESEMILGNIVLEKRKKGAFNLHFIDIFSISYIIEEFHSLN